MSLFQRRESLGSTIGFDTPISHPTSETARRIGFRLDTWWAKQAWWEKTLAMVIAFLVLELVFIGQPMVLTGQGNSMHGPRGLRDGGRELCIPLRSKAIVPGKIYAYYEPNTDELCLKRAESVEVDGVYFLGDNQGVGKDGKPESIDSRSYGKVTRDRIVAVRVCTLPCCFDGTTSSYDAEKASPDAPRYTSHEKRGFTAEGRSFAITGKAAEKGCRVITHQLSGSLTHQKSARSVTIKLPSQVLVTKIEVGANAPAVNIVAGDFNLATGPGVVLPHSVADGVAITVASPIGATEPPLDLRCTVKVWYRSVKGSGPWARSLFILL